MSRSFAQRCPVPPWRYRLAVAAERRLRDFNSQDLANTAWAFATVGHKEERLFTALEVAAEQRMRDFKSQDLANTAWALTDSAACTLGSC